MVAGLSVCPSPLSDWLTAASAVHLLTVNMTVNMHDLKFVVELNLIIV